MRTSGVICELNPFHNGHAYLLSRMREQVGDEGCVICLMSGRFVQRGEPAVADPYLRACTAMAGGADLVLELPFPWSCGSADYFAAAGVSILSCLGVDSVTFGSECGDMPLLSCAAEALASEAFSETYSALCRSGMGTTAAYTSALSSVASNTGVTFPDGFPSSNDLLGIAYLKCLGQLGAAGEAVPRPEVVQRVGAAYRDTQLLHDSLPSATALRVLLREAACDPVALNAILEGTMPDAARALLIEAVEAAEAPLDPSPLTRYYHAHYRLQEPCALQGYAEWNRDLAVHLVGRAKECATPEDFLSAMQTKQYTNARLRRALLYGILQVKAEDLRSLPAYTTLLAANQRGCAFLKEFRKARCEHTRLAVVTKPADAPSGRQKELSDAADALFTLCYPKPKPAGALLRSTPFIFS